MHSPVKQHDATKPAISDDSPPRMASPFHFMTRQQSISFLSFLLKERATAQKTDKYVLLRNNGRPNTTFPNAKARQNAACAY
jgi:hypothetical protein